jgi:hypothetical protein
MSWPWVILYYIYGFGILIASNRIAIVVFTLISLTGAWLNAIGYWESFILWTVANVFWFFHNVGKNSWAQAIVFLAYLISSIYGILIWGKLW